MNNVDKSLLLAESFGADVSYFKLHYVETIVSSPQYVELVENVNYANKFQLVKAVGLVDDFRSLNYNIKTIEQAVVLANRVNYLYSVSFENYYLNPLVKYPFKLKTASIGDLVVDFDGEKKTYNEIVLDEDHTLAYKAKVIADNAEYYRRELNEKNQFETSKLKGNKALKHIVRNAFISQGIRLLLATIGLVAMMAIYVYPYEKFTEFINLGMNFTSVSNYGFALVSIFSLISLLFAVCCGVFVSKFTYPYFYFKGSLRKRTNKMYKTVNNHAQQLAEYILYHCKQHKIMSNDISKFETYELDKADYDAYKKIYSIRTHKGFVALKLLFVFSYVVFLLGVALSIVGCILDI